MPLQPCAFHYCEMAAQRIINMNAGPEVGRRIRPVERGHQSCEQILPWHDGGTKIVPVRPERADDQKDCHSRKQEGAYPEIIAFIPEEKVEDDYRHVSKPQQIGDDKDLAEGDQVIGTEVDQPVVACNVFFQPGKPVHIDDPIQDKGYGMSVFVKVFNNCFFHNLFPYCGRLTDTKSSRCASAAPRVRYFLLTCYIIADQGEKSK